MCILAPDLYVWLAEGLKRLLEACRPPGEPRGPYHSYAFLCNGYNRLGVVFLVSGLQYSDPEMLRTYVADSDLHFSTRYSTITATI